MVAVSYPNRVSEERRGEIGEQQKKVRRVGWRRLGSERREMPTRASDLAMGGHPLKVAFPRRGILATG